jgi:MFS family permease
MFSRGYKAYALGAMTAVYTLNLVDRGLMMLLLQPIKEDLQLSDTQLGLLTGIAFGLFYATVGVLIARWADRGNRVTITSVSIGLWGLTVMACLLVTTYSQMVVARIAAAVGESGCKPPTYSLVGDYFPEADERARAMAIYISGNSLSALVAYIAGGWLNERYGWRIAFFLAGTLGLLLAVVFKLTIVEPRLRNDSQCMTQRRSPPLMSVMAVLWQKQSLRYLTLALILLYTVALGLGPWQAAFMIRQHGMGTAELGVWLGLISGVSGVAGTLFGGYVASRFFADNERAQMRLSALAVATILPWFVAFLMLPQKHHALMALIPLMVVFVIFLGPTYALLHRLVADDMRATIMAAVMLLANLVGMGIGPQLVGILSDALRPGFGDDSLRYAMLTLSVVALGSAWSFWRAGLTIRDDLRAAS